MISETRAQQGVGLACFADIQSGILSFVCRAAQKMFLNHFGLDKRTRGGCARYERRALDTEALGDLIRRELQRAARPGREDSTLSLRSWKHAPQDPLTAQRPQTTLRSLTKTASAANCAIGVLRLQSRALALRSEQ